jgi:hypothetical protein
MFHVKQLNDAGLLLRKDSIDNDSPIQKPAASDKDFLRDLDLAYLAHQFGNL